MSASRAAALSLAVVALALASAAPAVAPKYKAPKLLTVERIDEILRTVESFDKFEDERISLRDLLDNLNTGLPFTLMSGVDRRGEDAEALKAMDEARFAVRLPSGTMSVEQRLRQMLAATGPGIVFLLRRGHVEITTASAALRELRPTPENPLEDPESSGTATLPPMVYFARFDGDTLEDVCEKVAERAGINVAIDPRSREAAAVKIKARLVNVPADDALTVLADIAGLAVVRKANLYYLTTPKNAEKLKPVPILLHPGIGGIGGLGGVIPGPMTPVPEKK